MGMLNGQLVEGTKALVGNEGFKGSSTMRPEDFTRKRGMSFDEVVMFILTRLRNCSTCTALRRFFEKIGSKSITQQALSLSRYKIKVEAFVALFVMTVEIMLSNCKACWHGYRVLATDGIKIALPDAKALLNYYGGTGRNADSPTAQASLLYDVLNDIVVDAKIAPLSTDERTLAL